MFIEFTFEPKLLFILLYPIFKVSEQPITNLYLKKDNNLFKIFRIFLCNIFSFVFLLILKFMNKSTKKETTKVENEKNDEVGEIRFADMEIQNVSKKNKIKSILFIFLLSILYAGSYFFNYFVRKTIIIICRNSIGIIYEIIIFYILSLLILKEKYYKHHYLSISFIGITLIILFITYSLQVNDSDYRISKRSLVLSSLLLLIWFIRYFIKKIFFNIFLFYLLCSINHWCICLYFNANL